MEELVIETHSLTKRYGPVLAVSDLSLKVPRGGVFGLLGPNGSGKTTTMGMLLGLVRPTGGSLRLFGHEGTNTDALRRIGAVVETPAFYSYLSGQANLRYFQGISRGGSPKDVDRLLGLVGLSERASSKFVTYSQGMKQRLGIAYALLGDPELVFLDEPTNGLDPAGMAEARELIRELAATGHTILLSSHLLHEVEQVCDRVAILTHGHLIAQGNVQDLLRRQGVVRLKTTNNEGATSVLSTLAWVNEVRAEGGYLVATAPAERAWELTKALAQHDIYVKEMVPVQVSLEEYFMEVTGGSTSGNRQEASR